MYRIQLPIYPNKLWVLKKENILKPNQTQTKNKVRLTKSQ